MQNTIKHCPRTLPYDSSLCVVQMVHDPNALEPRCRLQEEDSDEYGAVIVPETAVAEAIRERTDDHLRKIGATVSAKPIVMRAECVALPG